VSKIILSKNFIRNICKLALNEDLYPSGDITSELISHNIKKNVKLISNQNGIIGGLEFAKQTFKLLDKNIKFQIKKKEGSKIKSGDVIALIKGHTKNILPGERVALNFLSHISGIATKTNKFAKLIDKKSKICCTRKTIPNMRVIQKYAVKLGGGINHRFNLSDEFLIKDNHISADEDIVKLVKKAIKNKKGRIITVEVDDLTQLK
jgi:nicotinate-nucleotide pyrophosphorylase (carboxylating)